MSCSKRAMAKRNHWRAMHSLHLGAAREPLAELHHALEGSPFMSRVADELAARVHRLSAVAARGSGRSAS